MYGSVLNGSVINFVSCELACYEQVSYERGLFLVDCYEQVCFEREQFRWREIST